MLSLLPHNNILIHGPCLPCRRGGCIQSKGNGGTPDRQLISKNCPERDSNPQSLAFMTSTLPTKPPRKLSRPGTNPGITKAMLSLINRCTCTCTHCPSSQGWAHRHPTHFVIACWYTYQSVGLYWVRVFFFLYNY